MTGDYLFDDCALAVRDRRKAQSAGQNTVASRSSRYEHGFGLEYVAQPNRVAATLSVGYNF